MILGGSKKLYYSHEKSKKELGYNPVSADNAIIEAIEWYRERGVI
jgi:nucleoside-diphosphate-sugar epimerase